MRAPAPLLIAGLVLVRCSPVADDPCALGGEAVLRAHCASCHSRDVAGDARQNAPAGVDFDTRADQQRWAARIRQRTLVDQTMPPAGPIPECQRGALDAYLKQLEQAPCERSCAGRQCGDDGCGGTCGACTASLSCTSSTGQCVSGSCSPSCSGRQCGDDGCGGSCGTCGAGTACDGSGRCACAAQCAGRMCGPDGCGGSCGTCNGMLLCNSVTGRCSATCTPSCTGRMCGDDGCGGSCGAACPSGQACNTAGQCVCAPSCTGKTCGDDGCGGTCGTCPTSSSCNAGSCTWPMKAYGADVHPLFTSCGTGMGCHSGVRPADNLAFTSASVAYAQLVGVASAQCSGRVRVVRNDIAASYLVNKLTGVGMCLGSRMPKGEPPLTAAQLDTVRAWIATGASP